MITMKVHPAAEVFPMLNESEFKSLVEDIRNNGLQNPLVVQNGFLIDGRNRLAACNELNIEPKITELDSKVDPVSYIVSTNLIRRHLNESQRAVLASKMANLRQGFNESDGLTQVQAAELLNVSRRSVQDARFIEQNGGDSLISKILSGRLSISAAKNLIKKALSKEESLDNPSLDVSKNQYVSWVRSLSKEQLESLLLERILLFSKSASFKEYIKQNPSSDVSTNESLPPE